MPERDETTPSAERMPGHSKVEPETAPPPATNRIVAAAGYEPSAHRPEGRPEPMPKAVPAAFAALGLSAGLFAGMSESPVAGTVISGVLGLITGGTLVLLPAKERGHFPLRSLAPFAAAVIWLCGSSVTGVFVGIELRTGALFGADAAEVPLTAVTPDGFRERGKAIGSRRVVSLLMLQRALDAAGIDRAANNAVISEYADEAAVAEAEAVKQRRSDFDRLRPRRGRARETDPPLQEGPSEPQIRVGCRREGGSGLGGEILDARLGLGGAARRSAERGTA